MHSKTGKKRMTAALSVVLVIVLGIGITLALLSQRTNDVINNFSVLGGLDVELAEKWDPGDGENIIPDDPKVKEPYMINKSESTSVYVGMQLYLLKGNTTNLTNITPANKLTEDEYKRLIDLIEIQYDTLMAAPNFNTGFGKWRQLNSESVSDQDGNGAVFIYDTVLNADTSSGVDPVRTDNLFEKVTISKNATSEDLKWIKEDLKGFDIYLRGAAVQADTNPDVTEVETEIKGLFSGDPIY